MRIIPSILTSQHDELIHELDLISEFADEVDIDIMDGVFVPNKSVPIKETPIKSNLTYNFDLMVQDPEEYINQILDLKQNKKMNVGRVFVHIESSIDLNKLYKLSENNFQLGFSLLLQTAAENFTNLYKQIKTSYPNTQVPVQLMTVQIGKQGNPYHPEVISKIAKIRQADYKDDIYIDGGVDPDIVLSLKEYNIAGVSVGSYITHSSDPFLAYNNLRDATWKKSLD